ncbi:hypothetical protein I6E68_07785 [Salinibacterium sp. NSLL150]|uniref:hypothetical protein n=1 Tax=unclassified Salinibacterium TaxID=2632331 RepID=UPI0018CF3616|nr:MULTISPECIES: hypothetical protein [unclassified Salinibacterium]MBH0099033.1 hypothetical protein [Salinibacterium sp. NSLL35]MBH0101787.1 hypothetical protein [Salinibacterium sp. NSLL150]MBH0104547.1 hypothetical protein [Salinibacterium sp. NSLL16]MBH0107307.1 hypothetical protein [Salinibacterium sp. NSLL17]
MSEPLTNTRALRIATRPPRTRLDVWPRRTPRRWMLRGVFALPYVIFALVVSALGATDSPNATLVARATQIDWQRADAQWLGDIFPPISTLLAAFVPGGALTLSIIGALSAGVFLQKLIEIMVQRRFARSTIVILMMALALNPLFFYNATQNYAAFLGLILFGLGMSHIVRFVAWGNTESGFRVGIYFMVAVLTDVTALVYVTAAALSAPILRHRRAGVFGARRANALVILYPAASALISLAVLNALFLGRPFAGATQSAFIGFGDRLVIVGQFFSTVEGFFVIAPLVSAWLVALIVRRPGAIIISTLVFAAFIVGFALGLLPDGSTGNIFMAMTLLAIALIPTARSARGTLMISLVGVLQLLIGWANALTSTALALWASQIFGG